MKNHELPGRRRAPAVRPLSIKVASIAAIWASAGAARAAPLKEPPPAAPAPLTARATPVNSRWIQLYLPEKQYDANSVDDAQNFTITSPDDAAFAGAGVKAEAVQHRHYPESGPYADDPAFGDPMKLNVIYRVYVKAPVAMTEGKTYTVTVAGAVNVGGPYTLVWGPSERNEAIHVNQVAYLADGPKIAYLSAWTGQGTVDFSASPTFEVINEGTNAVAHSGPVHLDVKAADEPWSKSDVYSMDFSSLSAPGKYHIHIPGVGSSLSFRIGADAFNEIGYTLLRGLTMQRDGAHGLDAPDVTHWTRPPAHLDDAIIESSGLHADLVGGHMDAGDRGRYPHNTADVSCSLLTAMRLFPNEVEALGESLQIPESGNGIPDLIDEATYELDFLYKVVMNTPKDGAVPLYLRPQNQDGSGGFEGGVPPAGKKNRKLYDATKGPNRSETLYAAGALAMAYNTPLMKTYLAPAKRDGYLDAAKKAFSAFTTHNNDPSFFKDISTYDVWSAGPTPWADEMLVAATNLLEATGDAAYLPPLQAAMPADFTAVKRWSWQLTGPWLSAFVSMYSATNPALTQGIPGIKAKAEAGIIDWGSSAMGTSGKQYAAPFGAPLPSPVMNAVGWFFSGDQTAYPAMVAYGVTHDAKYRDLLLKTWSYLLGGNPLSRTYISGLGDPERRPRWTVHEISQYQWQRYKAGDPTGWSEMAPGIPSADIQDGGFDAFINDPWNVTRKNNKFPAAAAYPALYRYHDSWTVVNEFTIDRLARGAVSIIPFVIAEGAPVQPPPTSGQGGAGGAPASNPGAGQGGNSGQGGAPSDGAPGDQGTNGPDGSASSGCTIHFFGAEGRGAALGWLATAALLALASRRRGRADEGGPHVGSRR